VLVVPVPEAVTLSGDLVSVHVPDAGRPLRTMLPVLVEHVRLVIVPMTGAAGIGLTVSANVATAARHGDPSGLLVVTVMVTILPASLAAGV
jgi:hypothetical protein